MHSVSPDIIRLAAVVESSDDAIISHGLDGTIETWNRSAERLFGYPASEAIGRSISMLTPANRRDEEAMLMDRVRGGEILSHFDTVACTRDGHEVPISLSISPVLTSTGEIAGISRIARDLTTQRALEREAFHLAAIVNSSQDAIVSKDLDGIVQTWNTAAERMFGWTAEEIVGRSIRLIIPEDRLAEEDAVLSRIRAGLRVDPFETVRRRKDGGSIEISLSVSPIRNASGVIIGASKIARDITVQRQLARAAEEADRVKDEFLATLSHELRTPLNAVLGYTRMLRSGTFGEERREQVMAVIERNATILQQLVSDVLDVSGIVTGKIRLNLTTCNLAHVVSIAVETVRPSAEAKGVALRVSGVDRPVEVRCDPDRMQQVFWNLLTNGVKFTPRGGHIEVSLTVENGVAVVTVADSGIGIRRELQPFVFQRFWQGESVDSRQTGGLGLGLALARHFVELHGGTVVVTSEGEGQGSTFTVSVPRA